jgi:protein SCO1/2
MKLKIVIASFAAFTLLASLAAVAIAQRNSGVRHYAVTGRVISIDADAQSLRIRHDEIVGYMPAMTMPFYVKETTLLDGVTPGASVRFRLAVTEEDSWISRMEVLPAAPSGPEELAALEDTVDLSERLEIGETVPNLSLVNQNGEAVRLRDFEGKAVLLTFIYTRCPLPNFCPLLSKNFAELQRRLSGEFPGQFQLVSLTIDPEFDVPELLKSYAMRQEADEGSWTFATGRTEEIDRAVSWFGLHRESAGGIINHDLRTALIDPQGKLAQVWKSNVWTPYEVQRSVRQLLTGRIDAARN